MKHKGKIKTLEFYFILIPVNAIVKKLMKKNYTFGQS